MRSRSVSFQVSKSRCASRTACNQAAYTNDSLPTRSEDVPRYNADAMMELQRRVRIWACEGRGRKLRIVYHLVMLVRGVGAQIAAQNDVDAIKVEFSIRQDTGRRLMSKGDAVKHGLRRVDIRRLRNCLLLCGGAVAVSTTYSQRLRQRV